MSGDFDYDETIKLVEKYWGDFEAKGESIFDVIKEVPLTEVVDKEVWGPEAERLYVGFRFDGLYRASKNMTMIDMVYLILLQG